MTNRERKTISKMLIAFNTDFAMQDTEKISLIKSRFLNSFTVDVTKNPEYLLSLLTTAYKERNAEDVEWSIAAALMFDLVTEEYSDILKKLLEADWHFKHEDIFSIFQTLKLPETVEILYSTALRRFNYLNYDEFYALAVKCLWALGEINSDEAKEKLHLLAQSENEIVRKNAIEQLERD